MSTAQAVLDQARSRLGESEVNGDNHTPTTERFADISGWEWMRSGQPWCQAGVTVCMFDAGQAYGIYAACLASARAFRAGTIGRWIDVNDSPLPGDQIYFHFPGGHSGENHTGFVESVRSDGRVVTLEANSQNAWRRNVRARTYVTGFGRPNYDEAVGEPSSPVVTDHSTVRRGSTGSEVRLVQERLIHHGNGGHEDGINGWGADPRGQGLTVDGDFGAITERHVKIFQDQHNLEHDGIVGLNTWGALLAE